MVAATPSVQSTIPRGIVHQAHRICTEEADKLERFYRQHRDVGTVAINRSSAPRDAKERMRVQLGAEANVHQGKAWLRQVAQFIREAVGKAKGKIDAKLAQASLGKADVLDRFGQVEELITTGNASYNDAFGKKTGFLGFFGPTIIEVIIRGSAQIAKNGNIKDKKAAYENIQQLEKYKELTTVQAALTKHAKEITEIKAAYESTSKDPALLAFDETPDSGSGPYNPHGTPTSPERTRELMNNPQEAFNNVDQERAVA